MNKFNYLDELKKIIQARQLVQIHFHETPDEFHVAYLLNTDGKFLTTAEVNENATFDGISIYSLEDIVIVKTNTIYLAELAQLVKEDVYSYSTEILKSIKKFTFKGFISGFEGTNVLVNIKVQNDDSRAGKIVAHDDDVVVFDEYKVESGLYAHAYIRFDSIIWMGIDIPWMRIISRSLVEKNL